MSKSKEDNFFNNYSEEERKALQESANNASSEGSFVENKLKIAGSFLMEVPTFIFEGKDNVKKTMPNYSVSELKGSLNLTVPLIVADGCHGAPKGALLYTNIVLCPAPGANEEKRNKAMSMMKPKIVALTGEESISITKEWFDEWLIPKYEEKDGKDVLIKDHKMKKKVMVITELEEWQGEYKPTVKAIIKAKEGDHSIPDEVAVDNSVKVNVEAPPDLEVPDISSAVDKGDKIKKEPSAGPGTESFKDDF